MTEKLTKVIALVRLLPARPQEVFTRMASKFESWTDLPLNVSNASYSPVDWSTFLDLLDDTLGVQSTSILAEPNLATIASHVRQSQRHIRSASPFAPTMDADDRLARLCYLLIRAARPQLVVETGVAHGVTSAFMLQAMQANRCGHLHSVDLPPLSEENDRFVGALIPTHLRERWTLHRGTSRSLLPPLLDHLGAIDLFVHDSLHTERTMTWEFETVGPHLHEGGILVSDDVQNNRAFARWSSAANARLSAVIAELDEDSLMGVSIR